jgi:hypothetical protein
MIEQSSMPVQIRCPLNLHNDIRIEKRRNQMRKLTATLTFVVLLTASAAVAQPNDSSDRGQHSTLAKIIRLIRQIITDPFEQPGTPVPSEQPGTPVPTEQPGTPVPTEQPGTPVPTSMWHP